MSIASAPNRLMFLRCAASSVMFIISCTGGLHLYAFCVEHVDFEPARVAAELDARGRRDAIEERKELLTVMGFPYQSASHSVCYPFTNDEEQLRLNLDFVDESSDLRITATTHLCLPGMDPYTSGGRLVVSDGTSEWKIDFKLLGWQCPSQFQSQIPKSRKLLHRLRLLAGDTADSQPQQSDFTAALESALEAKDGSVDQQKGIVKILRLLLASYFASQDFLDTSEFAEANGLIN